MLVYQSRHSIAFPDGGIKNTEKKDLASWPPWSWEHNVLPPKQEREQKTQDHHRLDALLLPRSSSPTETYYHVPWCPISYRSRKGIKWRTVHSFTLASAVSHSGPFEHPSQWQKNAIIIASNRNVDHWNIPVKDHGFRRKFEMSCWYLSKDDCCYTKETHNQRPSDCIDQLPGGCRSYNEPYHNVSYKHRSPGDNLSPAMYLSTGTPDGRMPHSNELYDQQGRILNKRLADDDNKESCLIEQVYQWQGLQIKVNKCIGTDTKCHVCFLRFVYRPF